MEFIRTYLCCCIASSHTQDDPERQPILQPDYEIPNEQSGAGEEGGGYGAVDQQKLERRLTGIVRSKESKMVKIGYTHPFNLHNKDPVGSETTISRSNSNSGSSFVHHSHHGHNHAHNHSHHNPAQGTQNTYASSSEHVPQPQYTHQQHQQQQQPQYAYGAHPYAPSPLSHSRSASRDPEDDSRPNVPYADEAEVYYDDDGEEGRAQPILNVRLVQRTKEGGGGGGEGDGRGRKRERVGAGGGGAGKQKDPAPAPPVRDEEELQTPTEATAGRGEVWEAGEVLVSKKQKKTFVLDDVDSIAVSWGD